VSNNTKNQRLGRGLSSLLGGYSDDQDKGSEKPAAKKQTASTGKLSTDNKTEKVKHDKKFHAEATNEPAKPAQSQAPDNSRIWKLAIDKIEANQYQPRQEFVEEKLRELSSARI